MAGTASETSIANAALILLGERRIDSLEGTSKTAKLLKERYSEVRDDTLRSHPWNFATRRASIAADTVIPLWGFDHAYTLPDDCLRLLIVNDPADERYKVEGRKVITNIDAPLEIEYTAQITDPLQMDVLFRQALSAALALDVAEAITGTTTKVQEIQALFETKLRAARVPDAQEPSPPQIEASEWLDAREETGSSRGVPDGTGTLASF